jgi:hypothetical protein
MTAAEKTDANGNLYLDAAAAKAYLDSHPYSATFGGWNSIAAGKKVTPATVIDIYRWIHRPKEYGNEPDLYYDVGAGGPVPGLSGTKFYISGSWNKSQYVLPDKENQIEYDSYW